MSIMPLMMLDLDNTLIDRDAAFRSAAADFLALHQLPDGDLDWLLAADASGYTPRETLVEAIVARHGPGVTAEAARALTNMGAADRVVLDPTTAAALAEAREAGWRLAIVTNGPGPQQLTKIRNAGLDQLVDGWVTSGEIGLQKPDPRMFAAAAAHVDAELDGAWMIGDSPKHDIAGAGALGLGTVWIGTGEWPTDVDYRPTHTARDVASAIRYVVARTP
jgi:putative hydrolase of the HAD superfamily